MNTKYTRLICSIKDTLIITALSLSPALRDRLLSISNSKLVNIIYYIKSIMDNSLKLRFDNTLKLKFIGIIQKYCSLF